MNEQALLHTASLAIFTLPSRRKEIIAALQCRDDTIVYAEPASRGIVAVIEADNEQTITELTHHLNCKPGVLSVNLVYHHVDTLQSLNQELQP